MSLHVAGARALHGRVELRAHTHVDCYLLRKAFFCAAMHIVVHALISLHISGCGKSRTCSSAMHVTLCPFIFLYPQYVQKPQPRQITMRQQHIDD